MLLAWMLAAVLPYSLSAPVNIDFAQLYMAGVIAVEGEWEALYATPLPDSKLNPAYPEASTPHPDYVRLAEARGVPAESCRFIYPPPVALLCAALGPVSYDTARLGFTTLCCVMVWWVGIQAGGVFRHLRGRPSVVVELGLGVLVCLSPAMINGMRSLNIAMFSCAVFGLAVLSLLKRREAAASVGFTLGGVFKATSGPLVVVAAGLGRWRALVYTAIITLAVIGLSLLIMGAAPFERFFGDIVPRLMITTPEVSNQSIPALLLRLRWTTADGAAVDWVRRAGMVLLLVVAWVTRQQCRRRPEHHDGVLLAGLYAAVLVWMIFNPLFWSHYHIVLVPFWGWLAWEVHQHARAKRWVVIGVLGVCFASIWFPATIVINQRWDAPELITSHGLWGSLGLLAYAAGRLLGVCWLDPTPAEPDSAPPATSPPARACP